MIPTPLVTASIKPFVFSVLAEGESYGYAIIQRVKSRIPGKLISVVLLQLQVTQIRIALRKTVKRNVRRHPLYRVDHSDRGSQYASKDYQDLLEDAGMICSMSRKGNCWDNAPVEAFFSTLKKELVYHRRYQTRMEARADIFEYIAVRYNRKRCHSSIGYLCPVKYEEQYYNQLFGNVA